MSVTKIVNPDFEMLFKKKILDKSGNILLTATWNGNLYFITEPQPERSSFIENAAAKTRN